MIDELFKIILTTGLLGYASYTDIKRREVSNRVWITLVVIGAMLFNLDAWRTGVASIGIGIAFSFILYMTGEMGAGDTKLIWGIAVMFPHYPDVAGLPLVAAPYAGLFSPMFLLNMVMVMAAFAIGYFAWHYHTTKRMVAENFTFPAVPLMFVAFAVSIVFGDVVVARLVA